MKTIGIYPGNFQPAHRGHVVAYRKLKQITPEVFVISTDKTPTPEAPLNFGEKEQILVRHGIPASHVIKVQNWKHPTEVYQHVSPEHTNAIFVLNPKETAEVVKRKTLQKNDGVEKEVWVEMDGKLSYFQPYKGNDRDMKSLKEHGYVMVIDDNIVDGKPISTANIREVVASNKYTEEQRKKFFIWIFGWFDIGLFQMISSKFKLAKKDVEPDDSQIKEIVNGMLDELLGVPPASIPQGDDMSLDSDNVELSTSEKNSTQDVIKARQDAIKKKGEAQRDLKSLQADLKWKEVDIKNKRKNEIPNKQKEIDQLNKSISSR